ncbi:hypothetical protein CARUB_v10007393mg [Capsella rubella]|uniref:Uncharacterized protein n=1 Tax=Capsella rubella TaxID=81985 RepID=R0F278_9BRAS|nr:uncharacterized protein LOC17880174 [Capsella rubella]EOA15411.1 hypothetical protein CARUB_v10007393mg [Capsella rubella]
MSTRLGTISFFFIIIIVFLVMLFVGASEARNLQPRFIIAEQIQIIHDNQIEEYDPLKEDAKLAYFGDLIKDNAKSAYYAYLHTKRLNIFGTDWLWRIDFLFFLAFFSFLFTNLCFRAFFCIASKFSVRFTKYV